jgi:hypothetical protein
MFLIDLLSDPDSGRSKFLSNFCNFLLDHKALNPGISTRNQTQYLTNFRINSLSKRRQFIKKGSALWIS